MDLILWRHAEAVDAVVGEDDLQRPLTARGVKHAQRMAHWLDQQLPEGTRILCSPALRTVQTAQALPRRHKVRDALSPGATVQDVLETAQWPNARFPVLLVGHQPVLGAVLAQLLGIPAASVPVRKGGVWWLRHKVREGDVRATVMAVMTPERL
ncbi:MAG: Phosphohistidine phosphatase SixA [Pseudomonadota bacterium]